MLVVFPIPGIPYFTSQTPFRALSDTYRNDYMRAVAVSRNDLETFNGFRVAYYIVQDKRSILLHPEFPLEKTSSI